MPAEFEADRRALIAAKLQKDHALSDEADRNWEQISNRRCTPFSGNCITQISSSILHILTYSFSEQRVPTTTTFQTFSIAGHTQGPLRATKMDPDL